MLRNIEHHPHTLLPRVDVRIQQLHQPLLRFQCGQHPSQSLPVLRTPHLAPHQPRHPLHVHHAASRITLRDRLHPELLHRIQHSLILAALPFNHPRDFSPNPLHAPPAKVLVNKPRRRLQLRHRKILVANPVQRQHTIPHESAPRHDHRQNPPSRQPRKVHMLQQISIRDCRNRHAHSARQGSQHMRRPLQQSLRTRDPRKTQIDLLPRLRRHTSHIDPRMTPATQLFHVHPKRPRRGYSPCRRMRLLQQSRIRQLGHLVPNRRRTHRTGALPASVALLAPPQQLYHRRRTHRLARIDVALRNSRKNGSLPRRNTPRIRHSYTSVTHNNPPDIGLRPPSSRPQDTASSVS